MPAIKPLVITDGTTPVTLNPVSLSKGVSDFRSAAAANRASEEKLHFEARDTKAGQRQYIRYVSPVTEVSADTGVTSVVENCIIEITLRVPDVVTDAQRLAFVKRGFDLAGSGSLLTELTTGEGQW